MAAYTEILYVRVSGPVVEKMREIKDTHGVSMARVADHAISYYLAAEFGWEKPAPLAKLPGDLTPKGG